MIKNPVMFASSVKKFCSAGLLGALLMVSGCGVGNFTPAPAVTSTTTQLNSTNATLNADGSLTTTADVNAVDSKNVVVMTIPNNTNIYGYINGAAANFPSLPININVSTPTSGVQGMPNPVTAGYTISSTAGAVEITIGSMDTIIFTNNQVIINIPIATPANLTTNHIVNKNKNDGNGWIDLGPEGLTGDVVTITTSNLCWFGVDNVYTNASGSPGGNVGIGQGF